MILNWLTLGGNHGDPQDVARRLAEHHELPTANRAKFLCDLAEGNGGRTWIGIAVEELAEVLEATTESPARLRTEWIQLAAVATAAVEAIDRRTPPEIPVQRHTAEAGVYWHIQPSLPMPDSGGTSIARTAEAAPGLLIDLGQDGRVLGIESLAGPIGMDDLIEILKTLRVTDVVTPHRRDPGGH